MIYWLEMGINGCEDVEITKFFGGIINKGMMDVYNYDEFVPEKFERWMRFDISPSLGKKSENFTLWNLEEQPTSLEETLNQSLFTVVEFGSFT